MPLITNGTNGVQPSTVYRVTTTLISNSANGVQPGELYRVSSGVTAELGQWCATKCCVSCIR